ncbi:MAG: signal recognition particle protein, partial [Planctomycetaceae bacterium]
DQILFVCDAMTGQDAVNSAKAFNEALELDGVILTKLDGDTRGGAALSVKAVTGVPIKYIGVGEQLDRLEPFHPDRMAGRILGMGDVVSLVERAQQQLDSDEMARQQEKLKTGKFTLNDFKTMMGQMRRMGPLKEIMKMIPGLGSFVDSNPDIDAEGDMGRIEAILSSMTPKERENPEVIDRSRRHRIARGSGTDPAEVNKMLKEFSNIAGVMQRMANLGMRDRLRAVKELSDGGMMDPNADIHKKKERSKRGTIDPIKMREDKKKKRKEASKQRKKNRR